MKKTYKGQSAGGILKTAKVVRMQAGNYEIGVKDRGGRELLAYLGEDLLIGGGVITDVLVLCCSDGVVARLSMSDRAYNKMRKLESAKTEAMKTGALLDTATYQGHNVELVEHSIAIF